MQIRKLHPHEIMEYINISSVCFEYPFDSENHTGDSYYQHLLAKREQAMDPINYHLENCLYGAFSDEHLLTSGIAFIPYMAQFDSHIVKLSGVGGVVTLPAFRRGGAIRAIFQKALNDLYQTGTVLSYLYPFSQSYYEKFGYALANPSLQLKLNLRYIKKSDGGRLCMYRGGDDIAAFETAYHKMVRNLMLLREPFQFCRVKNANPFKTNTFAFLYYDEKDSPCGYMVFTKKEAEGERNLNVIECVFDSPVTLGRMISFLSTYASDYSYAYLSLPLDINPEDYVTDMVQSGSKRELQLNGMLRVLNVHKALAVATYKGSGEIRIKVSDMMIPENNGIFHVVFDNGSAIKVNRQDEDCFDIAMPIGLFSSSLLGRYEADSLKWNDEVTIHNSTMLHCVFYKKHQFICDYF